MKKIDKEFIDGLFGSEYFCEKLRGFDDNNGKERNCEIKKQEVNVSEIDGVMDDIIETLGKGMRQQFETLELSNLELYKEIERIKLMISTDISRNVPLVITPPELSPKRLTSSLKQEELQTEIFFNSAKEMKEIRNTIKTLESEILESNQSILAQSFSIEENSQYFDDDEREGREVEFMIECKIDERFKTLEDKMNKMFSTYGGSIEQRIEQLKKTITSVVEAMNDPEYWVNNFGVKDNKKSKESGKMLEIETSIKSNDIPIKEMEETISKTHELVDLSQYLNVEENDKKNSTPSTVKSISSLNKSINFGRKKIKSLFGFGGQKKNINEEVMIK